MGRSVAPTPRPRHRWFAAMYDRMASLDEKKMAPLRGFVAGGASGRVLELGCGTGLNFAHFDWMKVEGVDATEPDVFMLERARARAQTLPDDAQAKLRLHEAPAEALPFEDGAFDAVVATGVFCTVADPARAFAEAWRVLRAGGELRFVEHVAGSGFKARVQNMVQPVYGWMSGGCRMDRDTEASLRAAGFEVEVTQRLAFGPLWPAIVGVATKVG